MITQGLNENWQDLSQQCPEIHKHKLMFSHFILCQNRYAGTAGVTSSAKLFYFNDSFYEVFTKYFNTFFTNVILLIGIMIMVIN